MFCHLRAKSLKVITMSHPFPRNQMRRETKSEGRDAKTKGLGFSLLRTLK